MTDLHEINGRRLVQFCAGNNSSAFDAAFAANPDISTRMIVSGALALIGELVSAEGFLDIAQMEALAVIAEQLTRE